eukprot:1278816-Pleurochrysis_carterae.AAC.1
MQIPECIFRKTTPANRRTMGQLRAATVCERLNLKTCGRVALHQFPLYGVDLGAPKGARSQRLQQALMACTAGARRLQKVGTAGRFYAQTLQP